MLSIVIQVDTFGTKLKKLLPIIHTCPVPVYVLHLIWSTAKYLLINIEFPHTAVREDYKHRIPWGTVAVG